MNLTVMVIAIAATAAANPNSKLDDAALEELYEHEDSLVSSDVPLDKNSFFIYNNVYARAKITQSNGKMTTSEGLPSLDQIWMLEESTRNPGYYYINSAAHEGYRLAVSSSGSSVLSRDLITFNGQYYEDQLWRFNKDGDYYTILNKDMNGTLVKTDKPDGSIYVYQPTVLLILNMFNQKIGSAWKLVPRFTATATDHVIWSIDNRQGTEPVTKSFSVTTGITLTNSQSVSTKVGFESSLTASVSAGIGSFSASVETSFTLSKEIERSLSTSKESSWSKETTTTFTAPAGKKYTVHQTILDFSSPYALDNCSLYSHERIEEQD